MYNKLICSISSQIRLLLTALLVIFLISCSSHNTSVVYYNKFDFSIAKTYSFYGSDSDFINSQSLSYAQRSRIELAIEKQLESQSFSYSDIENADFIVTYHWLKGKRQDYLNYNKTVLFCVHCLRANTWIQSGDDWEVYSGGLIIDLVNPKNRRSVWRSIHPLEFDAKDNSQVRNDIIEETIHAMLSHFPR